MSQSANNFAIKIYWSPEDQAVIAEVPELPGCLADGETQEEALANIEIIRNQWIETARQLNRPVPSCS